VLIGFMGSGKTAVGQALARRLGRDFVDSDDLIVEEAGMPIAEIFAHEGEPGFRRRERGAVARALAGPGRVVALGGGAPMDEVSWRQIRRRGAVVALMVSDEERRRRVRDDGTRPLLARGEAALQALLRERHARYHEADLVIDTSDRTAEDVAAAIQGWLRTP